MSTYNLGQKYEEKIRDLLSKLGLLPGELHGNDAGFIHNDTEYYLEVKNKSAPDFGQKGLVWSIERGWTWREKDIITELYDEFGVKKFIDSNFIPRRYTIPQDDITIEDKSFDQKMFEKSNIILGDTFFLYAYYARKKCYYIQIEEIGFYYLEQDIAKLNVPQFKPTLTLRLRAKTHHSKPTYAYSFFAVIQLKSKSINQSTYDLEEKVGIFPPIIK